MNNLISIPAHDKKVIWGVFDGAAGVRSESLVILAHGLTGRPLEFLQVMAARDFTASGYDVVRIAFYDGNIGARTLRESTLDLHARDLNTVVEHFRPMYKSIFIAGHSYGGFSLLFANPAVNAASFWDATWTPGWHRDVSYIPEIDCYASNNGMECLIGRAMYEEAQHYVAHPPVENAANFRSPAQVILAQDNEKPGRDRHMLFDALGMKDKELIRVEGADHQFTRGNTVESLIQSTKSWFERHL